MLKKILETLFIAAIILGVFGDEPDSNEEMIITPTHFATYELKMSIKTPRVYNNTNSLGFRKYQPQKVVGKMVLEYAEDGSLLDIKFKDFVNKTQKLSSGLPITYETSLGDQVYPRFNAIGSNRTQKFNIASVIFSLEAEPNYAIGEMDEDNGLYVTLSGRGRVSSKTGKMTNLTGTLGGTLGCGCYGYGHISPTRVLWWLGPSLQVDDVAAVYGTWRAKLISSETM